MIFGVVTATSPVVLEYVDANALGLIPIPPDVYNMKPMNNPGQLQIDLNALPPE